MKNIFKTLVALLVVSMVAFSCESKSNNEPEDPTNDVTNNTTNDDTSKPTEENKDIAITSQNLQGDWALVDWKDSEYPDDDMSYIYGRTIGLYEEGVINMQRDLWEDLFGYFDGWFYSSTTNQLIFTDSTLEFENFSFIVKSLKEKSLILNWNSITLTFEKK